MADAPPAPKKKLKRETPPPTVVDSPSGGMVSPPFGDPLSPNEAPLLLSLGKPEAKQGRSPPQLQMGSSSSGNFLAPPGAGARRPTLLERRNKADRGMSISAISGLCMDAIVDSSRDGTSIGEEQPKIEFRGWSDNIELPEESSSEHTLSRAEEMDELANSSDDVYSSKTCVKIVSYNILAARLVTTDRYPDSHPVILGEDYRIKLIKDEIKSAEPDILILSEISTEVHERLLGEFLRTQMNFYGEHVVITDKSGEPRCLPLGVPRQLDSIQRRLSPVRGESAAESRTTPVLAAPRSSSTAVTPSKKASQKSSPGVTLLKTDDGRRVEMDGTAIYYNKNRFTLLEKVAVRFNALAQADNGLTAYERKKLQVDSHNVALIVVLRDHLLPSQVYIVGGVHLIWQRVEAQLWQSNRLMNVVEQLKAKYQGGGGSVRSPIVAETPKGSQSGTRSSIDFSTQYTVTCILGGDFNIERTNPTFSYLRNGVVPPDTPVFKYWKAELEGESGSPTLLPPPERRITSQFPSPPTGDRSPHAWRRGSPSPEEVSEGNVIAPSPPSGSGRKYNMTSAGSNQSLNEITVFSKRATTSLPVLTAGDPETPVSLKRVSNPSSAEPSQSGGDQSSEIINILQSAQQMSPKHKADPARPVPPGGSPVSGRVSTRLLSSTPPNNQRIPLTHSIRLRDAYEGYCRRHPALVSAINPSTNMEGKVLDHILFEGDHFQCVRVMRLGKMQTLPCKDCPSDHYMVGAILEPLTKE